METKTINKLTQPRVMMIFATVSCVTWLGFQVRHLWPSMDEQVQSLALTLWLTLCVALMGIVESYRHMQATHAQLLAAYAQQLSALCRVIDETKAENKAEIEALKAQVQRQTQ